MRIHHIVAVVSALIIGFAVKVFFFASPVAKAEIEPSINHLDILQMHRDYPNMKSMPVLNIKDLI
jgi:hypothetical protein